MLDSRNRQFEDTLHDGITATKGGQRKLAQSLLNRATMLNPTDARAYIWLSATTDDPAEQREYLEHALAIEPSNVAARRGLAVLMGKIDLTRLAQSDAAPQPAGEVEAQSRSFKCPQCGGDLHFSAATLLLTCDYCGYTKAETMAATSPHPTADQAEQVLDFVMPTTSGHRWAISQHRVSCEHCGAVSLLQAGQKAAYCSYCGSSQFISSPELVELMDPQVIALMRLDEHQAMQKVKEWLGRGIFAPDNLHTASQGIRLRPAYYSCWTFDGSLDIKWTCEVNEGSGNSKQWVSRSGTHSQFFNDVLISGVKALTAKELASIEPFDLINVDEFRPEHLAGWPALIYDRSLSDASLIAREKALRQIRPQVYNLIEISHEKRNINLGSGAWSAMTFKHVLLPLWIGTYHFKNQEHHLLVNGQTGKVGGKKPTDSIKLILAILMTLLIVGLILFLVWMWTESGGSL